MKKKDIKRFLRTFYLSSVLLLCLILGITGIFLAYENTMITGFGEYKKAVEISDGFLRILDFTLDF